MYKQATATGSHQLRVNRIDRDANLSVSPPGRPGNGNGTQVIMPVCVLEPDWYPFLSLPVAPGYRNYSVGGSWVNGTWRNGREGEMRRGYGVCRKPMKSL